MKKRIPTLFGLILLLIALILLSVIYYYQERLTFKKKGLLEPKRIELVNLTEDSATITWQTDFLAKGSVIYGQQTPNKEERDYRDRQKRQNRITHYVTLKNLQPQMRYYYQIRVGDYTYPDTPLQFTTPADLEDDQFFDISNSANQPLRGTVVDEQFKPVDEAIVFLKIPGASKLATFVSTAGNFIIPLDLRAEDLKTRFVINGETNATIEILRGSSQSLVEITLPLEDQSLSYLQLGRSINLKQFLVSSKPPLLKFDLNRDNKVNSLDLSLVLQNFGKKPKDEQSLSVFKEADFNLDGVVDQKDFDLIKQAIK